jgi:AcrR family transcriptional regulator
LIEAGLKLFYRDGFHATGIDAILAEAGVAKKSLYTHFRSKEDLILAVMRRRDELFRNWLIREVEKAAQDPAARLLASFDVIGRWVRSKDFYGCACINASAEFGNHSDPIHRAAADHKAAVADYLAKLARAARLDNPELLSQQLLLLIDGAVVVAQVTGRKDAVESAKKAAETILAEAAKKHPRTRLKSPAKPESVHA